MCPRDQGRDIPWREGCHNHASPVTSEGIPLGHTCPLSPGKECRLARRVSRVSPVTRPGKVYPLARRLSHVTPVAREGLSCGGKAVTCDPCHQGRDIPWRESCHVCLLSPGKAYPLAGRLSHVTHVTREGISLGGKAVKCDPCRGPMSPWNGYPLAGRLSHVTPVTREGISPGGKVVTCDPCHQGRYTPWREGCQM